MSNWWRGSCNSIAAGMRRFRLLRTLHGLRLLRVAIPPRRRYPLPQGLVMMQAERGMNQREMRKRLGEVADLQPGPGVIFLAEKAEIVTQRQQTVQQGRRLRDATLQLVDVGEPEAAREKDPFAGRQAIRSAFRSVPQHQTV